MGTPQNKLNFDGIVEPFPKSPAPRLTAPRPPAPVSGDIPAMQSDWRNRIRPELVPHVEDIVKTMRGQGYDVRVGETNRTPEQEAVKIANGWSRVRDPRKGPHVGSISNAVDLIVYENGKPEWSGSSPTWKLIGTEARKRGLGWGGDINGLWDPGHVQFGGNLARKSASRYVQQGGDLGSSSGASQSDSGLNFDGIVEPIDTQEASRSNEVNVPSGQLTDVSTLKPAPKKPPVVFNENVDFQEKPKQVEFSPETPDDRGILGNMIMGARAVAGAPNALKNAPSMAAGKSLTIHVQSDKTPTQDQLSDALLEAMGAKEIGQKYRDETGHNLLNPTLSQEDLEAGYDPQTKTYSAVIQPRKQDYDVVNAYSRGGIEEAQKSLGLNAREQRKAISELEQARQQINQTLGRMGYRPDSEGNSPAAKGLADTALGLTHLLNNVSAPFRRGEDVQAVTNRATEAQRQIPEEKSFAGRVVRGTTGLVSSLPEYGLLPGLTGAALVEYMKNRHKGVLEAAKSAAELYLAGKVLHGVAGKLEGASPVVRQLGARGAAAATGIGLAGLEGERDPSKLIETGAVMAGMPIGKAKSEELPLEERAASEAPAVERRPGLATIGEQLDIKQQEPHYNRQNRRARNTVTGGRGQFKAGFREESVPAAKERSLPNSLEEAGMPKGSDLTYDPISNKESLAKAQDAIHRKGIDPVLSDLYRKGSLSADDTATGIELIRQLQQGGDLERAADVASHVSKKLTEAGQAVQAASIISRLSPEGVLLAVQRQLKPGQKLTPDQSKSFVEAAGKVKDAEAKISSLEQQISEMQLKATTRAPRPKLETLQDRLAKAEGEARARLEARKQASVAGSQAGASTIPLDIADYAIIGASKLAQKGVSFTQWTGEMVKEFGEDIRPHLRKIYAQSYRQFDEARKQNIYEQRARGAQRENVGPLREEDIQKLINQRLDAQTERRKARLELAQKFGDLTATPTKKFGRKVVDILGLPRALETTFDLSWGLRQGKMALARHPLIWAKGFGRQFKAFSGEKFERMVSEIESDADYKYAQRFKLGLTSEGLREPGLKGMEEAYQTGLADKVPGVKQSERAYTMMADTVKMGWFKDYIQRAKKAGFDPENPNDKAIFQQGADLINDATGRSKLPRAIEGAAPALNNVLFSPRFWVSRLKWLSVNPAKTLLPESVGGFSSPARVEALKTMFSFASLVTGQLALAKLAGANVSLSPSDPKFGKACWGENCVDMTAGFLTHVRTAISLERAIAGGGRRSAAEILGTYARGKESPLASTIHDLILSEEKEAPPEDGKKLRRFEDNKRHTDIAGQPIYITGRGSGLGKVTSSYLFKKFAPMIAQDALDAYEQSGVGAGVGLGLGSFLGEGSQTFEQRQGRGTPRTRTTRN